MLVVDSSEGRLCCLRFERFAGGARGDASSVSVRCVVCLFLCF